MNSLLDNIVWYALSGAHAAFSTGTTEARRYARNFSPIAGFANAAHPNLSALAPFCEPDEHLYCADWSGMVPEGWQVNEESVMFRMIWDGAIPPEVDDSLSAKALGAENLLQVMELTALTQPGPFGPRTIELGAYVGCFEQERLVAMAGERLFTGQFREISGVCTHPDFQGRGLARRLMLKLIRRQMQRNETPFLHVMRDNVRAHELYRRMGFRVYSEPPVRVISRMT